MPSDPRPIAVGLSHRTAAIGQRERAALAEPAARAVLRALLAGGVVREAAVLSTCNRVELYAAADDLDAARDELLAAHAAHAALPARELAAAGYVHRDEAAARHLFRVAASLDSMVVGESEIQGQVRAARDLAADEGALGSLLGELFGHALAAGRRVRARTHVGAGAVSLSSVAVELARARLGDLRPRRAALIGAGRTAEATARALAGAGVQRLVVVTRGAQAPALCDRLGATAVGLEDLPRALALADIVVSATSAPQPIVGVDDVRRACRARAGRPLVLIDLAVPRDVDPAVAHLDGVLLYDLDRLEGVAATNRRARGRESERAAQIVEDELARHLGVELAA
ncbi:MAG: glutamyl-tRNA reductase [Solirubrobacteraceae bacterium]|jgi:glutamyl-tRNA reductase|nr:glutamyl-tRNA reductase [Solirubrobacteraceae bacterium]